ncbi:MAG TPA: TadE family protein [Candidatus Bathyarchaeia archaeon]|nr:TadE family protein [Candidatus Bathyarchaeia archaeon]
MNRLSRFFDDRDDDRGQSLVEFALLLPLMLLIITGLFDVARAVWEENTLAYAAREGTRYAIVHGSEGTPRVDAATPQCGTPSADPVFCVNIPNVVKQAALGVPNVTVIVTYPTNYPGTTTPCADRNCLVAVEASAPFVPLPSQYLLNGAFQITLRGGSQLVIQR